MLDKSFLLKVTQAVIFSINNYEQDMTAVGPDKNQIKNKYRCNYSYFYVIILGGK